MDCSTPGFNKSSQDVMTESNTIYLRCLMISVDREFEESLVGCLCLGNLFCDCRQRLAGAVRTGMKDAKEVAR